MSFNFNDIGNSLNEASLKVKGSGVSFTGKSLKLDNEEDAKEVTEAIEKCKDMEYLDLEGNTLGPDAAKAISKAIEKNGSKLKRALWKDMFTGRMKDQIPVALEHLGNGLCAAGSQLVELDLSDNAFGPIGVKGLAALLSSSSCFTLQELRLNNNGLGITGGKLLAQALLDCHEKSLKMNSKPFALKVFIAGRNRLENEGAQALASVFEKLKSLEEVVMPQNGIYHIGISALANGLSKNSGLRILNLNDNTIGPKGSKALAKALPNFSFLEHLNLGDCLLKTEGAILLAEALGIKGNNVALTELYLDHNEIQARAVESITAAMADKSNLANLLLDGNAFGKIGREKLCNLLKISGKIESLGSLDEDESDDEEENSEDEEEGEEEEGEEDEDSKSDNEEEKNDDSKEKNDVIITNDINNKKDNLSVSVEEFLKKPSGDNFIKLVDNKAESFIQHAKKSSNDGFIDEFMRIIMHVSALCGSGYMEYRVEAEKVTDQLYAELFKFAEENEKMHILNNSLLTHLDLLKHEDKKFKIEWNLEGCYKALEKVCLKDYFLQQTLETLKIFIEKPMKISRTEVIDPFQDAKESLKTILNKMQKT